MEKVNEIEKQYIKQIKEEIANLDKTRAELVKKLNKVMPEKSKPKEKSKVKPKVKKEVKKEESAIGVLNN